LLEEPHVEGKGKFRKKVKKEKEPGEGRRQGRKQSEGR